VVAVKENRLGNVAEAATRAAQPRQSLLSLEGALDLVRGEIDNVLALAVGAQVAADGGKDLNGQISQRQARASAPEEGDLHGKDWVLV
jgi:hypothetical protein